MAKYDKLFFTLIFLVIGVSLLVTMLLASNRLESRLHLYRYDKAWCLAQEDMSESDCISFAGGD